MEVTTGHEGSVSSELRIEASRASKETVETVSLDSSLEK